MNRNIREEILRLCSLDDPRGIRRLIYELYFATPLEVRDWMATINLEDVYGNMSPRERQLVAGETKWMRILIRYSRHVLEKRGRVVQRTPHVLAWRSRSVDYITDYPQWVQQIQKLELTDPSPDFYHLYFRLERFHAETIRSHGLDQHRSGDNTWSNTSSRRPGTNWQRFSPTRPSRLDSPDHQD